MNLVVEYWEARELQKILDYSQWRRFENIIDKAKQACENSNINVNDYFANAGKMIKLAKGATRKIDDYKLSRYACYLLVQDADLNKEDVALGQTYFAVQTRN